MGQELSAGNLGQGTGDRELGTGDWGQGTGDRELGAGNWGQGTGGRELGTGNWDRGLGTGNWGNWGQGTWDREPGELGTGNWGQGTGDRELGTGNWGQGTGGRELGAANWGQGTWDRELGTGNLGQGTGTGDLGQGTGGTGDRELGNLGQGTGDRELGTAMVDVKVNWRCNVTHTWAAEVPASEAYALYAKLRYSHETILSLGCTPPQVPLALRGALPPSRATIRGWPTNFECTSGNCFKASSGMVIRSSQIALKRMASLLSCAGATGISITGAGQLVKKTLVARKVPISRSTVRHSSLSAGLSRPKTARNELASLRASERLRFRVLVADPGASLPRCLASMAKGRLHHRLRELGTGNWGQGTGGRELGAANWVGTGNLGQGTGTGDLGQGSGGTGDRELGTGNWGTWDRELGTGN